MARMCRAITDNGLVSQLSIKIIAKGQKGCQCLQDCAIFTIYSRFVASMDMKQHLIYPEQQFVVYRKLLFFVMMFSLKTRIQLVPKPIATTAKEKVHQQL